MGVYEGTHPAGSVMHWQCERAGLENNNRAAHACGGCSPHAESCAECGRASCSGCGAAPRVGSCNECGRASCSGCGVPPRAGSCNDCGRASCSGCEAPPRVGSCTECGRASCLGCGAPPACGECRRASCSGCGGPPRVGGCNECGREPCSACSTTAEPGEYCAGCGRRILDRFYLEAVERRWHSPCLRCCECRLPLDSEVTCFARDGNIFCKKDYYRLFGNKCARCQASISSSELVMRARDLVFHVRCFSCSYCSTPLNKGDHFGMRDSSVYCRLHYETTMGEVPRPPPPATDLLQPFYNGAPGTPAVPGVPRQKGRPRKRKPKDLEAMTASLDLNTEYLDMGFSRSGSGLGGSSRTKRMRTSFKHHQLRTMKNYFTINHNPDAKDLKQLSQKTGLPKRVLQVWFQNARAKWRRLMTKQECKMSAGKMSPEMDDICGGRSSSHGGLMMSPGLDCP